MTKSTRIRAQLALLFITNALTWWLTRQAYRHELARRERMTERRARTLIRAMKDG